MCIICSGFPKRLCDCADALGRARIPLAPLTNKERLSAWIALEDEAGASDKAWLEWWRQMKTQHKALLAAAAGMKRKAGADAADAPPAKVRARSAAQNGPCAHAISRRRQWAPTRMHGSMHMRPVPIMQVEISC